jgi:Uma2 family endonuclease
MVFAKDTESNKVIDSTGSASKRSTDELLDAIEAGLAQGLEESWANVTLPPSNLYSDEPPFESDLHLRQILLLLTSLEWLWRDRTDFFASANLTVYFDVQKIKSRDFRGPDFFLVLDTERRSRKSWVVWEEQGKYPDLIVEVLSDSTAKQDRTDKKLLYQNTFRTPEYFWFDPVTLEFVGFVIMGGEYQAIPPNKSGYLWSRQMNLYLGVQDSKLRLFTEEGVLVPMPEEAAKEAQQAAEEAQQKTDRLAERLRALGVDPDTV